MKKGYWMNMLMNIAMMFAKTTPVGMIVLGGIQAVIAKKNDGVSDKSYKDVMVAMAKSKLNGITEDKLAKAFKELGL